MRIGRWWVLGSVLIVGALGCVAARQRPVVQATAPSELEAVELSAEIAALTEELVVRHGEPQRERIVRGLSQSAALWRRSDGDFGALAREQFIADPAVLEATFLRLQSSLEQLDGHLNEISRELRVATDLEVGPLLPIDPLLSAFDPAAHLTEDLFRSRVAFVALLNFPASTLEEKLQHGASYTRREWAEHRLTGRFTRRVPASVAQAISEAGSAADLYIAEYNLWMHHVLTQDGKRLFPKGMRLISHWNLRDQLKADYADPEGLEKQRAIVQVMERIVTQTIPLAVIDNPRLDWNPYTNAVVAAPEETVEEGGAAKPLVASDAPEPDTRYARLLAQFRARKLADPFVPMAPTAIARSFELSREMPESRVNALLTSILTSPVVPQVAAEIEKRLGRKLEPQDLWFNGFQSRGRFNEAELDAITRKRYPTAEAFAADLPRLLEGLGFARARAKYLAGLIKVDASRGAGHAMPALRRGDHPRLRTRVEPGGMNYKGYNIAVHELGHNVEQVFSLYDVDHTLLAGVPNNAFTEALAFVFQARDLELLGLSRPDPESERLRVLNDFWQTWEIAGVALVDVAVWHWMYEHPDANEHQLRDAVVQIAQYHWDRFYAPVLGGSASPLLGIYSHMIAYPLYLPDYPLGHLIAFQIEEHLAQKGKLGAEFERMAKIGALTPDLWMQQATGAPVSADPLLRATERALSGAAKAQVKPPSASR